MPFKIIPTGNGFFMIDTADGSYRAGPNCTGDKLRQAATDHMYPPEVRGLQSSFAKLLSLVKDQAYPKPKKKVKPISAQDAYDIVSLIEAMVTRIRRLLDDVETPDEFEALLKASRLGTIAGLTEEEQAILWKQRQPYQEYWETHVYVIPGEVNTMPQTGGPNPWEPYGYKGAPYTWQRPVKDEGLDSLFKIMRKRLDADRERWSRGKPRSHAHG